MLNDTVETTPAKSVILCMAVVGHFCWSPVLLRCTLQALARVGRSAPNPYLWRFKRL